MPGEQVTFCGVGVARKDEGVDAHRLIGAELGEHLTRIADDCGAAAGAGAATAGPQIVLDLAFVARGFAQFRLAQDTDTLRVKRFGADGVAGGGIEL